MFERYIKKYWLHFIAILVFVVGILFCCLGAFGIGSNTIVVGFMFIVVSGVISLSINDSF